MSTAAKIHMAMRTPVRTAARMIVEVGTLFNSVEPSENMVMFKSAFVCTVCNGESGWMKLPSGVASADVMVSARVASCGVELAIVVVDCRETVVLLSRGGVSLVSLVSQITEVGKKVISAMYTLSESQSTYEFLEISTGSVNTAYPSPEKYMSWALDYC